MIKNYPEDIQVVRDVKILPKAIRDKGENILNKLSAETNTNKLIIGDSTITYNSNLQSLDIEAVE